MGGPAKEIVQVPSASLFHSQKGGKWPFFLAGQGLHRPVWRPLATCTIETWGYGWSESRRAGKHTPGIKDLRPENKYEILQEFLRALHAEP